MTGNVERFVSEGFLVLPNLVEAGEVSRATCDEIYATGFATRDQPAFGDRRTELFKALSPGLNKVLSSPTVRAAIETLLGPGYFMPAWNTHMHINGQGDGGFHADGTDHGPTQTTVRDHRPRQIFGFFYPGDVPLENGPTAVIPGTQYKAVDRVDPSSLLHVVTSEDRLVPDVLPAYLKESETEQNDESEAALAAADALRMAVAAEILGEPTMSEVKLTCKAGTVVLIHHDLFHRATRRLPDVWRPLFVLRDCVRMVEPVGAAWLSTGSAPGLSAPEPAVAALHRTFVRYLMGEGEERAGSPDDRRSWELEPPLSARALRELADTVINGPADIARVAAAYSIGRTQTAPAVELLLKLLTHQTESVRRASTYGLTVGGAGAAEALLAALAEPPRIPERSLAPNIDEQAALIPQVAHALSQLAAHLVSEQAVGIVVTAVKRAKSEIETFSGSVQEDGAPYEYYIIERRRAMVECHFALGHIGQIAAALDDQAVCAAACAALLDAACDPEPGVLFPSFMTSLRVVHSALANLIRMASSPSSCSAIPLVHGTPENLVPDKAYGSPPTKHPPAWAVQSLRAMAGEAAQRLRDLCATEELNGARRKILDMLERACWRGFELPAADEPSAYVRTPPMTVWRTSEHTGNI